MHIIYKYKSEIYNMIYRDRHCTITVFITEYNLIARKKLNVGNVLTTGLSTKEITVVLTNLYFYDIDFGHHHSNYYADHQGRPGRV